jgi:outer membrane protein assembly factor BamB
MGLFLWPLASFATEPDVRECLRRTGAGSGLFVHLGTSDARLECALARSGTRVVHGLATTPSRIPELRRAIQRQRLGGIVLLEPWHHRHSLPYPDRFVNLLIADVDELLGDSADPLEQRKRLLAEIERVLAVEGTAYLGEKGRWQVLRPSHAEVDDWTHKWHSPTGNPLSRDKVAGPPTSVQWAHGPAFADGAIGGKMPRIAGGKFVCIDSVDGALFARQAGNGLPLWRENLQLSPTADLVLASNRVYLHAQEPGVGDPKRGERGPLIALDLQTGKRLKVYERSAQNPEKPGPGRAPLAQFLVSPQGILQAVGPDLVWLDPDTGKRRWTQTLKSGVWFSPILLDDQVVVAECEESGGRRRLDNNVSARAVAAFGLAEGKLRWRNERILPPWVEVDRKGRKERMRPSLSPLVGGEGLILLHAGSYQSRAPGAFLAALSASAGKELWRHTFPEKEWTNTVEASRLVLRAGVVYYLGGRGARAFAARTGKPLTDFRKRPRYAFNGFGECSGSRGTVNWLIGNALCYWDRDLKLSETWAARSSCGTGVFPAHGMIFALPTGCNCAGYSRGYLGLACTPLPDPVPDAERRWIADPLPEIEESRARDDDWPVFLGNPQRTAATPHALPEKLRQRWRTRVTSLVDRSLLHDRKRSEYWLGALSAPVCASGMIVVACPEHHTVAALDAHGKVKWIYPVGGKVDTPPTIYQGRVFFGCHDGLVHALRLTDGQPLWRFLAAPVHRKAMLHGHLASAFPVHGSVLVLQGKVLATAGFHSYLGGIHAWSLDPATGKFLNKGSLRGGPDAPRPVVHDILAASADGRQAWLCDEASFSADARVVYTNRKRGPRTLENGPVVTFERVSSLVRYPHDQRGGSTHGWKQPALSGPAYGHRVVRSGANAYALKDPTTSERHPVRASKVAVVSAWTGTLRNRKQRWQATVAALGNKESYGAMILAGDRLYLGGGKRDGSAGFVQVLDGQEGKLLAEYPMPARVTECGLAAAGGQLVVSCEDGTVVCLGR